MHVRQQPRPRPVCPGTARSGHRHRIRRAAAVGLILVAAVTAISNARAADITVSAAASLTNAFREMARDYEARHPDARVSLNFGGSGALLQQMARGAPVDVLASADQETMNRAEQEGLVSARERHDFAKNTLVVIVPGDSDLALSGLADLESIRVNRIALGNPASVPVGRYARQSLEDAGLWKRVSEKAVLTQNVRQSLDYVSRAEVDAGFVYATDARLMKNRVKTAFEVPEKTPISYPIASTVKAAGNAGTRAEARRFVTHVLSPDGQAVLEKHGFRKP